MNTNTISGTTPINEVITILTNAVKAHEQSNQVQEIPVPYLNLVIKTEKLYTDITFLIIHNQERVVCSEGTLGDVLQSLAREQSTRIKV